MPVLRFVGPMHAVPVDGAGAGVGVLMTQFGSRKGPIVIGA